MSNTFKKTGSLDCLKSQKNLGLIGRKEGNTNIFVDGVSHLVTVIRIDDNFVTQVKMKDSVDGYNAIQLTTGAAKPHKVSQPLKGHYKKALENADTESPYGKMLREFRVSHSVASSFEVGQKIDAGLFAETKKVDVTGTSKGKGFAGVIKRHNFAAQNATHGNSLSHRVHGSTGQNQSPGRVFKGKKMAGQLGNVRVTEKNLEILEVNVEGKYILVSGAVPGPKGGYVLIRPSVQKS
jgi:large subunit ribosomal protein L3